MELRLTLHNTHWCWIAMSISCAMIYFCSAGCNSGGDTHDGGFAPDSSEEPRDAGREIDASRGIDAAVEEECGNEQLDSDEDCDGVLLRSGLSCESRGFEGGVLGCTAQCDIDTSGCFSCGNDRIDPDESCDGVDLGETTCVERGFEGGDLACGPHCEFDESGCSGERLCNVVAPSVDESLAFSIIEGGRNIAYRERFTSGGNTYQWWMNVFGESGVGPGTYELGVGDEASLASCSFCLWLIQCLTPDCDEDEGTFFPTAGQLVIESLGVAGDDLKARLQNVVLTEWDNGSDERVTSGRCIQSPLHSISTTIVEI